MLKRYELNNAIALKNEQKVIDDRLPRDLKNAPLSHETEELEFLVFAPSPISGLPTSDLSLVLKGGLSSEMLNMIQSLTMTHQSSVSKGFDFDKDAIDSAIPYQLDNETQLLYFYKSKGYDSEKMQRVLNGESFNEVFSDSSTSSDDSSPE